MARSSYRKRSSQRKRSASRSPKKGTIKFYCVAHKGKISAKPTRTFSRTNPRNKVKTHFACGKCPKCSAKMCRIMSAASTKSSGRKRSGRKH